MTARPRHPPGGLHSPKSWRSAAHDDVDWDWQHVLSVCVAEARRTVGRVPLAEDAGQEAALRAWRFRDSCSSRPDAWVRRIARNEALRLVAAGREEQRWDDEAPWADPRQTDELSAVEQDDYVASLLAILAPAERTLVRSHYLDDVAVSDLAEAGGVPLGTVKARLHRARAKLVAHVAGPPPRARAAGRR